MVPGSVMTLALGALFGLVTGTIVASLAATGGATVAFLLGRSLLRAPVARRAGAWPRFGALERAVREGGWRVVALMRLSPAIPFNLQNYFWGVTGIGLVPYVLASWPFMLPGTVLYVYLGHLVGAASVQSGAVLYEGRGVVGWWVLNGVGLLATILVTVILVRRARRALAELAVSEGTEDSVPAARAERVMPARRWPWGAAVLAMLAVVLCIVAACAQLRPTSIDRFVTSLFGPPAVTMIEVYPEDGTATVDHTALDRLLREHVDEQGRVDYAGLLAEDAALDGYLQALAAVPLEDLGRDERLALLINAYNAFTLRLILDHWNGGALESIRAIDRPWDQARWTIGPHTWSLNQIEHGQIRPMFREPRIHFALVCAAVGCPPLRNEAYDPGRLEHQLEDQARFVHTHDRWYFFDESEGTLSLTRLYDWYAGDFEQVAGSVPHYAAQHDPTLQAALDAGRQPLIRWLEYDWDLNRKSDQATKRPSD
jgi:uncharacterized membrane protein YdjX (TVP38/TMEM64 family)